jgi:hypothetical protein
MMRKLLAFSTALVGTSLYLACAARGFDEATTKQLEELQSVCDRGLVSEEVCREKQRQILGLPQETGESPSGQTQNATFQYLHPAGFSIDLPVEWQKVTPQEIETALDAALSRAGDADLEPGDAPDGRIREQLSSLLTADEASVFRRGSETLHIRKLAAFVNVVLSSPEQVCERFSKNDAPPAGDSAGVHECRPRRIGSLDGIYIEHAASVSGIRLIEFLARIDSTRSVQFRLSIRNENIEAKRREFQSVVESVRWN